MPKPNTRIRGLATIALLKTHFDLKRDHVSMFEPFLLDAICALPHDRFTSEELRSSFQERHTLDVPAHAINLLTSRMTKRGYLHRDGGHFVRDSRAIPNPHLQEAKAAIEAEHGRIAAALRDYARSKARSIETDDEALALLLAFLEENQFVLLLDDPASFRLTPPTTLTRRDGSVVASFLANQCLRDPELGAILNRMLEGFVLQNALLLRDIGSIAGRFDDLTVFFDSRFVFAALGLHGTESAQAAREDLELLKATSAKLAVFDKTLAEMRRVLSVYETKLGTSQGIRQLFPGLLTTYFVGNRYTPSDVREVMALLDSNIHGLGITIRSLPAHNPKYTLDESSLAKRIAGSQGENEPRVVHDVDCIAGVLTLRAGYRSDSWERAKAVFSTTTGRLVSTTLQWYRESGEKGVPPIVNQFTLSSIAWLKRPAGAKLLKLHELVALCSAALRPTRQVWEAFLQHLHRLERSGHLSSDEAVAIVANDLTQSFLVDAELGLEDETPDPELLTEVVERVRSHYKQDADTQIAAMAKQVEAVKRDAETTVTTVEVQLGAEREAKRQLELRVETKVDAVADICGLVAFALLAVVMVAGSIASYLGITGEGTRWSILVPALIALVAAAGVWTLLFGGSIWELRGTVRHWMRARIRDWFFS